MGDRRVIGPMMTRAFELADLAEGGYIWQRHRKIRLVRMGMHTDCHQELGGTIGKRTFNLRRFTAHICTLCWRMKLYVPWCVISYGRFDVVSHPDL